MVPGIKEGAAVEGSALGDGVVTTGHYCLAGSVEWGDHCWKTDTGSWKRVSGSEGITDVEGRVLRDKVVIVLGLVLVEG